MTTQGEAEQACVVAGHGALMPQDARLIAVRWLV
jgi:hypothetical protein